MLTYADVFWRMQKVIYTTAYTQQLIYTTAC
jgi:hypothetical protein